MASFQKIKMSEERNSTNSNSNSEIETLVRNATGRVLEKKGISSMKGITSREMAGEVLDELINELNPHTETDSSSEENPEEK